MPELRVAFVPLARTTFDLDLASQRTASARQQLEAARLHIVNPTQLITDLHQAEEIASLLVDHTFDLLLIFQSTFADSTMITKIVESLNKPVLLWAIPEEHTGGRLRLNSLCGINLAGHALTLRKKEYQYLYASPEEQGAIQNIKTMASAGYALRRLRNTRLGVIGEHPPGMDSCRLDEPALRKTLGVEVVHVELNDVFDLARSVDKTEIESVKESLTNQFANLEELEQTPLNGSLSVYTALKQIARQKNLESLAVRCWPEFFSDMGCAACGAMSMLSDEQIPCSCEADANGTLTQLILQWLSGEPAFGSDMVSIDEEQNALILWHCGLAPLSMANPDVKALGGIHSNRRVPLVMEFPLKPGRVTLARLSQATGQLRMVIGLGEMIDSPQSFSGTAGTLHFDRPVREVLDVILSEGLEHHISLTYGDYQDELQALAKMLGLPVLHL